MGAAAKLMIFVTGTVMAAVLMISLIWGGWEELVFHRFRNAVVKEEIRTGTFRVQEDAEYIAALGTAQLDNLCFELEHIFRSGEPLPHARKFFRNSSCSAAEMLITEIKGKVCLVRKGTEKIPEAEVSRKAKQLFRYAAEKAQSRKYCVCFSPSGPETFWVVYFHDAGNRAALRINGNRFLRSMIPVQEQFGAVTVLAKGRELVAFQFQPDPDNRTSVGEIRKALLDPNKKQTLLRLPAQMPPVSLFDRETRWYNASSSLKTVQTGDTEIRVFRSVTLAGRYRYLSAFCRQLQSSARIAAFLPAAVIFFAFLLPLLLAAFQNYGAKLRFLRNYADGLAKGQDPGCALRLKGDPFLREFSEILNLLRERYHSAMERLKETRDREMKLLMEADDTKLLRNGMLEKIVLDMNSNLQLAAGYSNLQAGRMDHDTPEGYAAKEIAVQLQRVIFSLYSLADLARLGRVRERLVRKKLDVSLLMRYAVDTAAPIAGIRGLIFETGGAPSAEQKLYSSPEILSHLLSTSLALVANSAPRNSRVILTCLTDREELIFLCRSLRDGDFSALADYYSEFSRNGIIPEKEYASCILRLKALAEEAAMIGGDLKVFRPEEGGNAILLNIPFRELTQEGSFEPEKIRHHESGGKVIRRPGLPVTVCVADDSPEERKLISWLLSGSGYVLTCPESRDAALELMRERDFDILLLDAGEDMNSMLPHLRKVPAATAVAVMLPSFAENPEEYVRNGVDLCLMKPLSAALLREAFYRLEK